MGFFCGMPKPVPAERGRSRSRSMDGSLDGADVMGQSDCRQATYRLPQAYTRVEGGPQVVDQTRTG